MVASSVVLYLLLASVLPSVGRAAVRTVRARAGLKECADSELSASGLEYFDTHKRVGAFPSPLVTQAEADVTSAQLISVAYGANFKILTESMSKEQYVLIQCGTLQPTDAEMDAVKPLETGYARKHFTIPLQMAVAQSSVQLSFLEALGVQDRIGYLSQTATGPCWQRAVSCGADLESSYGGNATLQASQMGEGDAVFMDCASSSPIDCSNVRAQVNGVHFSATQDSGPLHSAEHIKFLAAFFNKEVEAQQYFTNVVQAYSGAAVSATPKPIVAWISYSTWPEASFVLSQASYKTRMVKSAGGANKNGTSMMTQVPELTEELATPSNPEAGKTFRVKLSSFNGSLAKASSAFFAGMGDVDAVVDETYASIPKDYTLDTFLTGMGLEQSSNLRFVRNRQVYRIDGTISATNQYDWYESRIAHPDWAVEGFARVIHGDASKRVKYFRNLAEGEMPHVLTPEMCTVVLPVCNTSSFPTTILMLMPETSTTSSTTAPDSTASGAVHRLCARATLFLAGALFCLTMLVA